MVNDQQLRGLRHLASISSGSLGDLRRNGAGVWVLVATIVGSSLVFIDGAIVTLALPQMQRTFGASSSQVAWVIESYTLMLGSLMLLGGAIGDRYGRRAAFTVGTVVFGIGSIGCALAPSIQMVIAARVVQGFGGMLLAPASLALIGAHFTGEARGRAIAMWSSFGALTSSLGPALGGLIIDHWGWRAAFFVNVPLIALVLYATMAHLDESRDESLTGSLDFVGAALNTFGLGCITFALISASGHTLADPRTGGTLVAGIALLVVFVFRERRAPRPILPLYIFKSTTFTGINLATLLLYGALSANFFELPLVMIQGHGYTATQAALSTLPLAACLVLLSRFGTALAARVGRRFVLTIGPAIAAVGFGILALLEPLGTYWTAFFPGILVVGIGLGFTVAPLTATAIDAVDARHIGLASGINNATSRVAGLLAIAAVAIVVTLGFNRALDHRMDLARASQSQRAQIDAQRDRLGGAHVEDPAGQAMIVASFRRAFQSVALMCVVLAALAAVIDALMIRNPATERRGVTSTREPAL